MEKKIKFRQICILLCTALLASFCLSACAFGGKTGENSNDVGCIKILATTDLHYVVWPLADSKTNSTTATDSLIDGSLTDATATEKESTIRYGGLAVSYEVDLLAAFRDQIKGEGAAVLILTGDLVQKGDDDSLYSLAEILHDIESDGTEVLILPGNHDLRGEGQEAVNQYRDALVDFGFNQAIATDTNSLSYVAEITPTLRVLMLDTITNPDSLTEGSIDDPTTTLGWIREQLEQAREDGVRMITASHENILDHNSSLDNFRIVGAEEVAKLYEEYGVIANVCGDIHIQNIREENGLTDIAEQPLSAYPNAYGVIELTEDTFSYHTKKVDVEDWAKAQGLSSEILLNFTDYSLENFKDAMYGMTIYDTEDEELRDYLAEANFAFFTGRMDTFEWNEELTERWKEEAPDTTWVYLESLRVDLGKDYTEYMKKY